MWGMEWLWSEWIWRYGGELPKGITSEKMVEFKIVQMSEMDELSLFCSAGICFLVKI